MTFRSVSRLWVLLFGAVFQLWAQGGPPGARVAEILVFPSSGNLLYAATDAGVFRSDNSGLSWSARSEGLTSFSVHSLAGSPTVLFAGTDTGPFRSADGGASWQAINQGLGEIRVFSLARDPQDSNTLYAGTRNGGIFKTTTAGDNWSPVNTDLPRLTNGVVEGNYHDLAIDPTDSQVVYAAWSSLVQPGLGAMFKTTDGGAQWVGAQGPFVLSVTLAPSDNNTVYLGTSAGIIRTTDAGQTFEVRQLPGVSVADLQVSPDDPNTLYAATRFAGIAKSTDAGTNWEAASTGLPSTEMVTLTLDHRSPARLYAGTNAGGVFRTLDGAATWQLVSKGINAATIRGLAVNPIDTANVLASSFGGGIFRSTAGGGSWQGSFEGLRARQVVALAFDPTNPATVYAGSLNPNNPNDGALFRSTDGANQWEAILFGTPILTIAIDPSNSRRIYIGTSRGIFRSDDDGQNFLSANTIKDTSFSNLSSRTIRQLVIDPNNPATLYALSAGNFTGLNEIFKTTNRGDEWEGIGGQTTLTEFSLSVDPGNSNNVFVGTNGGIFRSTDGGDSFQLANTGLPSEDGVAVTSIVVDGNNPAVYAATNSGVYKSDDLGNNWAAANVGLESVAIASLAVDPKQAGTLYAATLAGGVFKTVDRGATWTPTGGDEGSLAAVNEGGIVDAADFVGGGVAPGEIVSIFGTNLGPAEGVQPGFDQTGKLPTSVADVTVFFNDTPAPLFFLRWDQINAQAPFEIAGSASADVRVEIAGTAGNIGSVLVVDSHPGVFNAVLNQDLTVNSSTNPAAVGSFVSLFATGQGQLSPDLMTGQPGPSVAPLPAPQLPVSATVDGLPVQNLAVAMAPGLVGLLQINIQLSPGLSSGQVEARVTIGTNTAQTGAPVFVQ